MVYQIDSYRYWERTLGRSDFTFGQFSENFNVEGLPDDKVCIGDRYRIGDALFEVTQRRVTCYRVEIRMNDPRMPIAILVHMYHEIAQPYALLYNLVPALKPGGRVGIVDAFAPTSEHGTPRCPAM